ncbi:MAG: thiamine phosphate synthase [Reichenbachiella sp.]|uniref:thiamine phosphate synthase n=2 Tax=Reichenbachiella sp. TaxID=2184521 RepID=UPI003266973E
MRKPLASEDNMRAYLGSLDQAYLNKVSLHGHHDLVDEFGIGGKHFKSIEEVDTHRLVSKSFHSFESIEKESTLLTYGFLSPIYDSISKVGYKSDFNKKDLKRKLSGFDQFPIYALGGIETSKIDELLELGFDGAVLMGTIWSEENMSNRIDITDKFIHA